MSYFWQGQWGELYMGDGMKHEDITYFPVQPPTIMEDPSERSVHEEPNPIRHGESLTAQEELISKTVDQVWGKYDADGNGFLDKEECFAFVRDSLKEMGQLDILTEDMFEKAFNEYDADGTGKISRGEMAAYLKKLCGFE